MPDLSPAWEVLRRAQAEGAFPGAVGMVFRGEDCLGEYAVGGLTYDAGAQPVNPDTRYDLASVTKPFVASAVLTLVDAGIVDLEASLGDYLPRLRHLKGSTIRRLLSHTAGLASRPDLHEHYPSPQELQAAFDALPLAYPPGSRVLYTSLGYQYLGEVITAATGQGLDAYLGSTVLRPIGASATGYLPPASLRPSVAPTEYSPVRRRLLAGEVHDENAYILGGVCGHAGLFGTARDVARLGQALLGYGQAADLLSSETRARLFRLETLGLGEPRSLAFVYRDPQFGGGLGRPWTHTGFTGTSLCLWPEAGIVVALVSNRVHPTRTNRLILEVRKAFHDAVARCLGGWAG